MSDKTKKKKGAFEKNQTLRESGVNLEVNQVSSVNAQAAKRFKTTKRRQYSPKDYMEGILSGNRIVLSQAITLVESSKYEHQKTSQEIIKQCLPHSGKSIRIGITGVPGAGKSTFIETFGKFLTGKGHRLAVLAIDPSSERSKGSILGDKTRMEELAVDPLAYIRPSPASGSLGGVARKTRETLILCEAAGFDKIVIETVGVGQSETAVHSMVDFFLLIQLAGAGDELQGIKRGIMEMADAIVINKADGNNVEKAQLTKNQYEGALHLFSETASGWIPQVLTCSSIEKKGIDAIWEVILKYCDYAQKNNFFEHRRNTQAKYWMYETINEQLRNNFYHKKEIKKMMADFEKRIINNEISSFIAASRLLETYYNNLKNSKT